MADKKAALLLFSKPPIAGMVKTRLCKENGGLFTPEQAAAFYTRCFYDVSELSMHALIELQYENDAKCAADPTANHIQYDFVVSTTPADNVDKMRKLYDDLGQWPMEIHYMSDKGATFDDHFDDAISQLFAQGYDHIVAISGDIPTLPKSHLSQSFEWLEYFEEAGTPGFVMAPCQECGTSLIGQSKGTPINNQGVYYNMSGRPALDAYIEKIKEADIPCAYFPPIADIDETEDLAHAISCLKAIKEAARYQPDLFVAQRVLDYVDFYGIKPYTPPNDNHDPRQYLDDPQ